MQRHLRRKHGIETVEGHQPEQGDAHVAGPVDKAITKDFAYQFVLTDLTPLRFVSKKGCMGFMRTHVKKRIGGRKLVRRAVREWHRTGQAVVKNKILKAKGTKCRFGLSMDTWKRAQTKHPYPYPPGVQTGK